MIVHPAGGNSERNQVPGDDDEEALSYFCQLPPSSLYTFASWPAHTSPVKLGRGHVAHRLNL